MTTTGTPATPGPAAGPAVTDAANTPVVGGGARALLRRVWHDRNGRIGLLVTGVLLLIALAAALGLTPYDPVAQRPVDRLTGPSAGYWFGTDQFGRDIASRVFAGVGSSLRVAVLSVGIAALLGTLAGVAAGFAGGIWDQLTGRLSDVLFAFPATLLALAVIAALGRGWVNTAIAIALVYVPIFVRVARGPTLSVREADYVKAGRVLGFSPARLLFRHVLPNVGAPVVVQVALALSWAIMTESALSFLGLGTQPPDASLGAMVNDARTLVASAWWTLAFPAAAIVVAVLALNLLGDGLRSALDPRGGDRQ